MLLRIKEKTFHTVFHPGDTSESSSSSSTEESIDSDSDVDCSKKIRRIKLGATDTFIELKRAFQGILKTYYLQVSDKNENSKDICNLLYELKPKIKQIVKRPMQEYKALKFNIVVEATYTKELTNEFQARAFKTLNYPVFEASNLNAVLNKMILKICNEETEYEGKGSGWALSNIDGILIRFSKYHPLGGSSYMPLPDEIANKHACINVQNFHDNECFRWSILARYVEGRNPQRLDNRYFASNKQFNFDNLTYPVSLDQITKFEKQNPGVSVNVYGLNEQSKNVYPLRIADKIRQNHFDLLLISKGNNRHYCYIKSFSRLLSSQVSKHKTKAEFCKRCLTCYKGSNRQHQLQQHMKNCQPHKPIKTSLPRDKMCKDNPAILEFANHNHSNKLGVVVYCDFECLLQKKMNS